MLHPYKVGTCWLMRAGASAVFLVHLKVISATLLLSIYFIPTYILLCSRDHEEKSEIGKRR